MPEKSFLQHLLDKKANVLTIGEQAGADVKGAVTEVKRQIRQCLQGGEPIKGRGVTKSKEKD